MIDAPSEYSYGKLAGVVVLKHPPPMLRALSHFQPDITTNGSKFGPSASDKAYRLNSRSGMGTTNIVAA